MKDQLMYMLCMCTLLLGSHDWLSAQTELLIWGQPTDQEAVSCLRESLEISAMESGIPQLSVWDLPEWASGASTEELITLIHTHFPGLNVQPNHPYQLAYIPNDPLFPQQTGLANTGYNSCLPGADIGIQSIWDDVTGDSNLVIVVIDGGVDIWHPDLAPNIWHNPNDPIDGRDNDGNGLVDDYYGWDFVNDSVILDRFGNDSLRINGHIPMDDGGHGTHVAGIIGAKGDNGIGIAGVCWDCKILPIKFADSSGTGTTLRAIQALDYVVSLKSAGINIKVVNNSWGGTEDDPLLYNAIRQLDSLGILFVAAAGNNNGNANDLNPYYPASLDLPNIISVTAVDCHDLLASSANIGPTSVDVAAPGVAVLSALPDSAYGLLSGTSMAAPYVAGAVAMMYALNPDFTPAMIKQRIIDLVTPLPQLANTCLANGRLNISRTYQGNQLTTFQKTYAASNGDIVIFEVELDRTGNAYMLGYIRDGDDDVFLQKLDPKGNVVWARTFGGQGSESNLSMVMVGDSSLAISTNTGSFNTRNSDLMVFKLDLDGNIIWETVLRVSEDDFVYRIDTLIDKGLLMVGAFEGGDSVNQDSLRTLLWKTDATGHTEWVLTYAMPGNTTRNYNGRVISLSNGKLMLTGLLADGNNFYSYLDPSGQPIWSRSMRIPDSIVYNTLTQTGSGNVILGGWTTGGVPHSDIILSSVDTAGNIVWMKRVSTAEDDIIRDIKVTKTGDILIAGYSQSVLGGSPTFTAFSLLIDELGRVNGLSGYSPIPQLSAIFSGYQAEDGGFLFAGTDLVQAFLVKTDPYFFGGCGSINRTDIQVIDIVLDSVTIDTLGLYAVSRPFDTVAVRLDTLTSDITDSITVSTNCIASLDCNLTVSFELERNIICQGETLNLESLAIGADELEWTVNDRIISQAELATYQFNNPGEFKVELIGRTDTCELTASTFIQVIPPSQVFLPPDTNTLAPAIAIDGTTPNAYRYTWTNSMGDILSFDPIIGITRSDTFILTVEDQCGFQDQDSIIASLNGNGDYMVSGDVNLDGFRDLLDWALVNIYTGVSGPARSNATPLPVPEFMLDWLDSIRNPFGPIGFPNAKHLDCDGNGSVEAMVDGPIVIETLNRIHPDVTDPSSPYKLKLTVNKSRIRLRDTIELSLNLINNGGSDSLYAMAVSLYRSIPFKNPPILSSDSSLFGLPGVTANQVVISTPSQNRIDFGFTRMGQEGVPLKPESFIGGGLTVSEIEDIDDPWLFSRRFPVTLTVGNVMLVGQDTLLPVNGVSVQSTITIMVEVPSDLVFARIRSVQDSCSLGQHLIQFDIAEKNADSLLLEQSFDSRTFTTVERFSGQHDTTTLPGTYTFAPSVLQTDTVYYRFRVIGNNDSVYLTPVVAHAPKVCLIEIDPTISERVWRVYPNPTHDRVYLQSLHTLSSPVKLQVRNLIGEMIYQGELETQPAGYVHALDLGPVPAGVYLVTLLALGGHSYTLRLVVEP